MKPIKQKFYLIALLISLVSINTGCKKEGIFGQNGKGSTVTEERIISGFTSVELDIDATLFVTQGSDYSVKVEAQENLMDAIKTEVVGSELRIKEKHCINKHDPIKIYVTMPHIENLTLGGSGSIITASRIEATYFHAEVAGSGMFIGSDSIIADYCKTTIAGSGNLSLFGRFGNMTTEISGSGNINLKGVGNDNDIEIDGSGDVHAFDLPVKTCSINISGSGNAEVNVSEQLDVNISGSGDVFYYGSPIVSVNTSGSGSVLHKP
jgi:hypothetical protein